MGPVKRNSTFEHAHIVRIDIILHMVTVSSGLWLSIDTFYIIQLFWQRTADALIRMRLRSLIWAFEVRACPEDTFALGVAQTLVALKSDR